MSILDTIEMLHKRASGERPDAAHAEEQQRKLALELEKQAFLGRLAWAMGQTVPETIGKGVGHAWRGSAKALSPAVRAVGGQLPAAGSIGGASLGGLVGGPAGAVAGAALGNVAGRGVRKIPSLAAEGVARAAALPFDHPAGALVSAGMAWDLANRMAQTKHLGDVASNISSIPRGRRY